MDPLNPQTVEDLRFALGREIQVLVAPDYIVEDRISQLYGGDGNDRLSGDIMFGGAGSVRFFFTGEFGTDRFKEFRAGPGATDVIELSGFGGCWDSCAEVMASERQVGADTQLRFGKVNDVPRVIVLENMAVSSLSADDFQFT